jgi:hypothetical protein
MLLILYAIYGLTRPVFASMKIGVGADVAIGLSNGLLGGLTGRLGDVIPEDHMVRKIDAALDLSWLRSELTPHYSSIGRPSIDPELMIRMLVVGYAFAIRSLALEHFHC